ncbi:hypothetical protein OH492_19440 [Vibrio chagasii]|nr:hypothetical protein [Vibrio chagasii]
MTPIFIVGAGWVGAPLSRYLEDMAIASSSTKTTQAGAGAAPCVNGRHEVFDFDSMGP